MLGYPGPHGKVPHVAWGTPFFASIFGPRFCMHFYRFLPDFGSHLGSIFSHFAIILHSFFQHRFRIDFSSISGWIFHRIFIIFAYKFRSATEPREPWFWTTVWRSAPKIEFLPSSIFHVFLVFFDPDFTWILHRFLMVFWLHFGWLLHHFSILFRSRNLIDFWMAFL